MPLKDPLKEIARWASQIRQGDFSARIDLAKSDFSSTEDDINRLAEWLESLAQQRSTELETRSKLIKNQADSLRVIYDITSDLNKTHDVKAFVSNYLKTLTQLAGAQAAEAYMLDDSGENTLVGDYQHNDDLKKNEENCLIVSLSSKNQSYGEYRLHMGRPIAEISKSRLDLLSNIGLNLGMALENHEKEQSSAMVARMADRTAFAHELHDSMAQTLASLRFQVRILDDLLQGVSEAPIWTQMETVEKLVELAHGELRSLIGQFRAPIEMSGGLNVALKKILARFRTESGIPAYFQNQCDSTYELPEDLQVSIIRIAQESLKNICKHSKAETVRLLIQTNPEGECFMLIEDDGIGFDVLPKNKEAGMHIGLSVMKERAQQIGGELLIQSELGEGTRIKLTFAPT